MPRDPILSFEQYRGDHLDFSFLTAGHHLTAWGEGKLTTEEIRRTLRDSIECGYAVNMHSRVAHAAAAAEVLDKLVKESAARPLYAIDLVCRDFIFEIKDGREFDVRKLRRWVKARLPGIDFIGGIDLAYYYAGDLVPGRKPPFLSWHAHVIAWGVSEDELRALECGAEAQFSAGWEGAKVFYSRKLDHLKAVGRAMYALKSPMSEYSVGRTEEHTDDETGEVKGGTIVQNKRALRPTGRIEIIRALGARTIHDLTVAGGRGKKIKTKIFFDALMSEMSEASAQGRRRREALGLPLAVWRKLSENI